jgi:phosphoglycerate kinase
MLNCPKISDIKNKTVLVRVDFNVPLKLVSGKAKTSTAVWRVADNQRILAALETINYLIDHDSKVVLMSHLGRPKGEVKADLSLAPVARFLKNNLDLPVQFVNNCVGEKVAQKAKSLESGQILLLENLRFYEAEKKNNPAFAKNLVASTGAEVFVNEAFSACHRAHASVVAVPKLLPSFAGFGLKREVKNFNHALDNIKRPFVLVMGGAKISDKVNTLRNLADLADVVLLGGGIANAFLRAGGIETHKSFVGSDSAVEVAKEILQKHATERVTFENTGRDRKNLPLPKIVLPIDVLAAKNKDVKSAKKVEKITLLQDVADTDKDRNLQYLDLGSETLRLYSYILNQAKTIVWNGPIGVFENPLFARGSRNVARAIARATDNGSISLVGGGESNSVINSQLA